MQDCPSCDESFDTRRGLGVHHSRVHDERLPNRECDHCSAEFYSAYEKRYCSDSCHDRAVSYEGSDNPNWRGGRETAECEICNAEFDYYPSEKQGFYCGTCVEIADWRYRPRLEGEANPRWAGGEQELTCEQCGAVFRRERRADTDGLDFCSPDCQYEWLSEAFTGDGHPNWRGGSDANYGQGWNRVRRRALERDGYRCVVCGTTKEELGRNPDVHHIVPVRAFVEHPVTTERDAHYLANLVSLCIACHRKAEFGRIARDRLFAKATERPR